MGMPTLAIDCRMIRHSGIGSFTRGVLNNLPPGHDYALIGDPSRLSAYAGPGRTVIECLTPPFSLAELRVPSWLRSIDALFCPSYTLFGWSHGRRFVTVHDVLFMDRPEYCRNELDRKIKNLYLRFSCFRSKGIFTVSRFSAQRLRAVTGTKRPVTIVPNGLLDEERDCAQARGQVEKDPNLLVFVGNLKRHKNLKVLLGAMRILGAKRLPFRLVVVGAGDGLRTRDEEILLASKGGMNLENVVFAGWMDRKEMLALIAKSRYLVQPSLYEGFSIPPLEALACGTQPLLSDIPVHREIYQGSSARYFDPFSEEALAREIQEEPDAIGYGEYVSLAKEKGYDYQRTADIIVSTIAGNE